MDGANKSVCRAQGDAGLGGISNVLMSAVSLRNIRQDG